MGDRQTGLTTVGKLSLVDLAGSDSKLTELLQDGLGGSAKTLLFVNASPADYNFSETVSSFEFALRCKKVKNKKAGAHVESAEVKALKQKLHAMQALIGPAELAQLD